MNPDDYDVDYDYSGEECERCGREFDEDDIVCLGHDFYDALIPVHQECLEEGDPDFDVDPAE